MPMLPSQQNPSRVGLQQPEIYDTHLVPAMFTPASDVLLTYIGTNAGECVLNAARGTRLVSRRAAARVGTTGSVTGFDINSAMVAVVRRIPSSPRAPIFWPAGDAHTLPFDDVFWWSRGIAPPFRGVWNSEVVGRYQLNEQI